MDEGALPISQMRKLRPTAVQQGAQAYSSPSKWRTWHLNACLPDCYVYVLFTVLLTLAGSSGRRQRRVVWERGP